MDQESLNTIDLSYNQALKSFTWQGESNRLEDLVLPSNNTLTHLSLTYALLNTLDLSSQTQLESLTLDAAGLTLIGDKLASIDLSSQTTLESLTIENTLGFISVLQLPAPSALTNLLIRNKQLDSLDLSQHQSLNNLIIYSDNLRHIDFSVVPISLRHLYLMGCSN